MNVLIYWVNNANKLIIVCDTDTETGLSLCICLFIILLLVYHISFCIVTSGILRHNPINSMWVGLGLCL